MRWVKQIRPHMTAAQRVMKKIARNEKMVKTMKKNKSENKSLEVSPENHFVLCNGMNLRNIEELAMHIETLDDSVYSHHVNDEKNDFANWIGDVFNEYGLADSIRASEDRHNAHVVLLKHLAFNKKI